MDEYTLDIRVNDGRETRNIPCPVPFHGLSVPLMHVLSTPAL